MNRTLMLALRQHRSARANAVMAALCALLFSISALAGKEPGGDTVDARQAPSWKLITVKTGSGDQAAHQGLMLFTTEDSHAGAAFRCQNGQLFAYLSTRPLDFKAQLDHPFANARNREVSYRIDGVGEGTEIWVQMYRGRVYLVTELPTTVGVFEAAMRGGEVSFTRKHQDPLSIVLPSIGQDTLDDFLAGCELESRYRPSSA